MFQLRSGGWIVFLIEIIWFIKKLYFKKDLLKVGGNKCFS